VSFFIGKNETVADLLLDSDMLMRHQPDYYGPSFEALHEMREADPDGKLYRGSGFRHVASLKGVPWFTAIKLMEPDFMSDKNKFYEWLDRGNNKRYCVYDRRSAAERKARFDRDFGHIGKEA
jgi:hypothetical protein